MKFLKANVSRKVDKDDQGRKRRRRTLYVMKEAFIGKSNKNAIRSGLLLNPF